MFSPGAATAVSSSFQGFTGCGEPLCSRGQIQAWFFLVPFDQPLPLLAN
jgi:hypothetical protein